MHSAARQASGQCIDHMQVGCTPAPTLGHQRGQPQRLTASQGQLRLGACDTREKFGARLCLLVAVILPPGFDVLSRWRGVDGFFVPLLEVVIAV